MDTAQLLQHEQPSNGHDMHTLTFDGDLVVIARDLRKSAFRELRADIEAQHQGARLYRVELALGDMHRRTDFAAHASKKHASRLKRLATKKDHEFWEDLLDETYQQLQESISQPAPRDTPDLPRLAPVVTYMSDVQAEQISWLWYPYLARKKIALLDGDPGVGKTLLVTQLAANLSVGNPLPDQQGRLTIPTGKPQVTLILTSEDGLADTLKPRLEAAGADHTKVCVLEGWYLLDPEKPDQPHEVKAFTLQHMAVLEEALKTHHPALVVIDPIQSYLGDIDMHRANETRPLLAKLTRLAEAYNCAIVCIRHPAKPGQGAGKVIHRGLGSVDFIGAARTALYAEQHPTDGEKVLLAQSKSNIGPLGRTQVFTKHEGQFLWCGVSRLSAEMMAGSGRGPDPYQFLEAVCWLETVLSCRVTPKPQKELMEDAEEEGISWRTLQRAKKALNVRSIKKGDGWDWQLPDLPIIPIPPHTLGSLDSLGVLGSLDSLGALQENQHLTEDFSQGDHDSLESQESQGRQVRHIVPHARDARANAMDVPPAIHTTSDTVPPGTTTRERIDGLWDRKPIPFRCPACGSSDWDTTRAGEVICIPCEEKEAS